MFTSTVAGKSIVEHKKYDLINYFKSSFKKMSFQTIEFNSNTF